MKRCLPLLPFLFAVACLPAVKSHAQVDDATHQLSHDIFKQLIEINTTDSVGNVTTAAEAMQQRFRDAGFAESDMQLLGPNDRKKNLVVRLHGSGKHKPMLMMGHLDVVEASRADWNTDPFQFVEKDGYYYGRGTEDMKDGDAIMVATLIRFKKEGFVPDRDIIVALTADEEGGTSNGMDWLLKNHRELIDAEFAINLDGGGVVAVNGKPLSMKTDPAEKLYSDYQLVVTNPGGHSSLPVPDNAIYHLAEALVRVEHYQFPVELNSVTRGYYEEMAKAETGQRAADMRAILKTPPDLAAAARLSKESLDNATLHTTCVATRLTAGHANNALPARAEAIVNCRILPGHSSEEMRQKMIQMVDDSKVTVRYVDDGGGVHETAPDKKALTPPPLREDVMSALRKSAQHMWPGIPVIPEMGVGASDDIYTDAAGIPSYDICGEVTERGGDRSHGDNERVQVTSFYGAVEFNYRFLRALTGG